MYALPCILKVIPLKIFLRYNLSYVQFSREKKNSNSQRGRFSGGKNNACKVVWAAHVNTICGTGLAISGISKIIKFSTSDNAILAF